MLQGSVEASTSTSRFLRSCNNYVTGDKVSEVELKNESKVAAWSEKSTKCQFCRDLASH